MGFIGCEVAASLRQKGVAVVAIEPSPTSLFRVLGEEVGTVVAAIHRDHGVEAIFDDRVTRFEGVALNRGKDVRRAMPLIRSRGPVDPDRLQDEDIDLRRLAPAPAN